MNAIDKLYGWNSKLLDVDLSRQKVEDRAIEAPVQEAYLGGRGLNMWILQQNLTADIEPFSPQNLLIFGAGPLVGTVIPANGRYNVSSRSPLTGLLGDANSAGFWAPPLRKLGYDGIIVRGKAEHPTYLLISGDRAKICDATSLWGKTVSETDTLLRKEHGKDSQVLCIGPAGEKLVRFAAVLNNVDRAAGRTGNGAVMGSKNLKAIVVQGKGKIPVADPEHVRIIAKEIRAAMRAAPSFEVRSKFGTPMLVSLYNEMGVLPTNNHQLGVFKAAGRISGERLKDEYVIRPESCYFCPVHCSRQAEIKTGRFAGVATEGPEFESMCAMGSNLGNDDLASLVFLNRRLNDLGMDSISTGGVISYAMECYQNGLIGRADTDGLELTWGNTDAILEIVELIAARQGLGDLLAEGVRRATQKIPGSEHFALHIKGMEVPTQEVRGLKAWGLAWAVASRGGDHCRAFPVMETTWSPQQAKAFFGSERAADRFAYEGKAAMVKWAEDFGAIIDSLGICKIAYQAMGLTPELIAKAFQAVTGIEMDGGKILQAGERINNLERLLNLKLGLSPKQDTLPARFTEEPLPEGPSKGETVHLDRMMGEYYDLRGWDPVSGSPSQTKLKELGIAS
ncbi:MAG: aldehyde ferredoxin oxidoreductase family protein [Desulfobacterales bacterium]